MRVGVLGTGNMGTILIESMIGSQAVEESDIYAVNRSEEKLHHLKNQYPNINISQNESILKHAEMIFLCVRPLQFPPLLEELGHQFKPEQYVASITSPIHPSQIESYVQSKVLRSIPSITNRAGKGSMLLTYGNNFTEEEKQSLDEWFGQFSVPLHIDDSITRAASDIVSCGPAFFSSLLDSFIGAAEKKTLMKREEAELLVKEMVIGLSALLEQGHYDLPSLQRKVNVPGGITGKGLSVIKTYSEGMFEELFETTHEKYDEDKAFLSKEFRK